MTVSKKVMRLITMSVFMGVVSIVGACGDKDSAQNAKVAEIAVTDEFKSCPTLSNLYSNKSIATIHFDFDKTTILPSSQAILSEISDCVADLIVAKIDGADTKEKREEKLSDFKILIEGHCDSRGTVEYNMALGARRAVAAKMMKEELIEKLAKKLENANIEANELTSKNALSTFFCTTSKGKSSLVVNEDTEYAHKKNRRDEFYIVKSCSNYEAAMKSDAKTKTISNSDSEMMTDEVFMDDDEDFNGQ